MENIESSDFDIKEYFTKIKKVLYNLGYENKTIDINTAMTLYETYGNDFSEETFVKEVLDVNFEGYKKAKSNNKNIIILKTTDSLSDEEISKLKQKLFTLGYAMRRINYDEFSKLYNNFGQGLRERTFAIKVLNLSYSNYRKIKDDRKYKTIILKNSGNIEEIISKMIEEGYENYIIRNYDDFLSLYSKFGYSFSEVFFSENILKISYDDYRKIKKGKVNLRILVFDISDNIENLKNILKDKGYNEMLIDYEEFLQLYQKYGTIFSERDFALKVLNLTQDSYKSMKLKNTRARILKTEIQNNNYQDIKDELVKQGFCNKTIDYEELKQIFLQYGKGIDEKEFALNILDLSLDSYRALRKINNKDRFKILKNEIPKEIKRIKNIFISKCYSNKKIYYEELHDLYLKYGTFISERQFAMQVLEIGSSHYQNIKYATKANKKLGAIVLPFKKLTKEKIKKIKDELIKKGYEDSYLTREEIDRLYLNYNDIMSKTRFVEDVLGVYNIYSRPNDKRINILKKIDSLDDEKMEKLKHDIFNSGYYYRKIKPEDTYELYDMYGNGLTYNTFVTKILGITRKQIGDAKAHNSFVRVIDINVKNIMEMITKKYLTEIRYYSKKEILSLCNNYNVDLDNFLLYSLVKNVEHNHKTYKSILNNHDKLWIGNNAVSNEIISKYYYEIEKKIMQVIMSTKGLYPRAYDSNQDEKDDFQELLLFFIENGSEIEKNFMVYNDDNWGRYLHGKIKRRMLIKIYNRIVVSKNENKFFVTDDEDGNVREFRDDKTDVEEIALNLVEKSDYSKIDNCILSFGQLLSNGTSIIKAKEIICDNFAISELELLHYMKLYINNHNIKDFDLSILDIDINDESNQVKKLSKENINF